MTLFRHRRKETPAASPFSALLGPSPAIRQFQKNLEAASRSNLPILIQGESGTGKGFMARLVHQRSLLSRGVFEKIRGSCVEIEMLEAVLAGNRSASLPYNSESNEISAGITVFFNHVEEIPASVQTRLLHFLEDHTESLPHHPFTPAVPFRFVFSSTRDLSTCVEEGTFRRDLLYRIGVVKLIVPPLRNRREDIPSLVDYFLNRYAEEFHTSPPLPSPVFLDALLHYHWPGNILELSNVLRSYVLFGDEDVILQQIHHVPSGNGGHISAEIDVSQPISLKNITRQVTSDIERQIILKVLQAKGWNRQKTAQWLQMSYRSLLYKLDEIRGDSLPKFPDGRNTVKTIEKSPHGDSHSPGKVLPMITLPKRIL